MSLPLAARLSLLAGMTLTALPGQAQQKTTPVPPLPPKATVVGTPKMPALGKPNSPAPPVGTVPATAHNAAAPVELRMKFKQGDINRYQMTMQANIILPGQPAGVTTAYDTNISLMLQQQVVKTNPDGSAEVAISTLSGSGVINGQSYKPALHDKPSMITFDAQNNILTAKNLPRNASSDDITGKIFQSGALSTQGVYLPKQPVKIGDSWTQKVNIASLSKSNSGTVKTTFVRTETIGLFNTARLRSVMKIPFVIMDKTGKAPQSLNCMLSMVYDSNLALAEGKVVRSTGSGDITVVVHVPTAANPGQGKSSSKTNGTKPGTPAEQTQKVTVKLQLGNNLITQ